MSEIIHVWERCMLASELLAHMIKKNYDCYSLICIIPIISNQSKVLSSN